MPIIANLLYFILVLLFLDIFQKIEIFDNYLYHYEYIKNTIEDRRSSFMLLDFKKEYKNFKNKDKLLFKALKYKSKLDNKFIPRIKKSLVNQGIDVNYLDTEDLLVAIVIATKKIYRKDI